VYFDDFKITHSTRVEQSDEYYPFGLTFNSTRNPGSIPNQYLYNSGTIFNATLGVDWYETQKRIYDPALGQFRAVDPRTPVLTRYKRVIVTVLP
jgi:hypothetical protein